MVQRLLQLGWRDGLDWAAPSDSGGTSTRGASARIDFVLVNPAAAKLVRGYSRGDAGLFPGHRPISLTVEFQSSAQRVLRSSPLFEDPCLPFGVTADSVVDLPIVLFFVGLLLRCLLKPPLVNGVGWRSPAFKPAWVILPFGSGRGRVEFGRRFMSPSCHNDAAISDSCEAMLRVLRRCRELLRVTVPVERLLATWSGIARGTFQLPPRLRRLVCLAGSVPFSRPAVRTLLELFSHELETTLAHERAVRLQLWARRMRASVGSCHGWLKRRPASQGSVLGDAARLVAPTANFSEQFKAMLLAWSPVFNKFADGEPDAEAFFAQFGSVMASSSMPHTALTGSRLREAVSSSALTAAGLDGWSFAALKAVAACCPALFDELALLLQLVEDTGCWPYSMTCAAVALIPKDSSISEPGPSDLRPLSILSCLYRLWAKARLSDIVPWQDRWLADGAFGFRPGHSAEGLFFATALDLEAAEAEGHPCAGISFDLKKAFDALPPCLLIQILRRRGCAECILRPLAGFYRHLHRRFRLNGVLGREFHSSSGIPQGCPISPFLSQCNLGRLAGACWPHGSGCRSAFFC